MAVSVPALFGIVVLGETLSWNLALGLTLTLAAIIFMAPGRLTGFQIDRDFYWYLPLTFAAYGITQLWTNLFNNCLSALFILIFKLLNEE